MKFFNHPEALSLDELRAHQASLFARRRLPNGYHLVPTFLRAGREFGIDRTVFAGWLEQSRDLADVYDAFTQHMCEVHGTTHFVEKTPSNIYSFATLAELFPELPLVHQIRDGRDVVVSFMRRRKSLFRAASLWLYDTVCGLRARGASSYLETRYEDLAFEPEKTLERILAHLGLEYDPIILSPDAASTEGTYEESWHSRRTPRAWNQTPNQPVSSSSVGRYREQLSSEQLSTICRVRLTDKVRAELDSPVATFGELLDFLGYQSEELGPRALSRPVERSFEVREYLRRALPTLRYQGRLPQRLTTIAAASSPSVGGGAPA
jgi:hypothetical protein